MQGTVLSDFLIIHPGPVGDPYGAQPGAGLWGSSPVRGSEEGEEPMRGTMWLMALGCGILLSSSGCCGFLRDGGCGRGCGCESCGPCDGDCGPTCGPVHRPYRERIHGDDCGQCGASCGPIHRPCRERIYGDDCGECGGCGNECGPCCQRNFCFHPLRWIGSLFYAGTWCGPCCGNTYWGEGISDPPDCHDPCNHGGHWTGHGGCASCNHGGEPEGDDFSPGADGVPLPGDPVMEPTLAPKAPTSATQRAPAYNYQR